MLSVLWVTAASPQKILSRPSPTKCVKNNITYKAINIYEPERYSLSCTALTSIALHFRYVYFISDVPHLLKTTRNCRSHSGLTSGTRLLIHAFYVFMCMYCIQVNGKYIVWDHLIQLAKQCQPDSGLYIGRKIKHEHLHLTSYSRMSVKLATQVDLLL